MELRSAGEREASVQDPKRQLKAAQSSERLGEGLAEATHAAKVRCQIVQKTAGVHAGQNYSAARAKALMKRAQDVPQKRTE